ncbi:MAG: undecaprenyl-diphosphate phosphatase [Candidatus Hodarchaeales archaeon]
MNQLELIIVAIMQGVVEWMPVSSEGQVVLVFINILQIDLVTAVSLALFLHLGTMVVVLIIFRKEFLGMAWHVLPRNDDKKFDMLSDRQPEIYRNMFWLLVVITLGTTITAVPSVLFVEDIWNGVAESMGILPGEIATFLIGLLLIITGILLLLQKKIDKTGKQKSLFEELTLINAFILGLIQGLAAMPGISRSGITITALLFMNLKHSEALKGSFIASVPASMGATILLLLKGDIAFSPASGNLVVNDVLWFTIGEIILALAVVFIVGALSMVFLLKISEKVPYWQFCIGFGLLAVVAVIIGVLLVQ